MISIRCSSLPLIHRCPQAARAPALCMDFSANDETCNIGSAGHEAICRHINGEPVNLYEIAQAWDVDEEDLRPIYSMALMKWMKLLDHYPDPMTEQVLFREDAGFGIRLDGHCDVLTIAGRQARILDWKFGFRTDEEDYRYQMMGYAYLACVNSGAEEAEAVICWPRLKDDYLFTWRWSRAFLESWWNDLRRTLSLNSPFTPGLHCRRCPRQLECPARKKQIQEAIHWFHATAEQPEGWLTFTIGEMLPEDLIRLSAKLALVKGACEQAQEALKDHLRAQVGQSVVAADRRTELALVERFRKEVDYTNVDAREALRQALGEETVAQCLSVNKGQLEKLLAGQVERGKGKRIKEFMDTLESLGALERKPFEVVECRKAKEVACQGK